MLKALFLDLDETLCDTTGANNKALAILADRFRDIYGLSGGGDFAQRYIKGIYRELDARYQKLLMPIENEETFRIQLIELILADMGIKDIKQHHCVELQQSFDQARTDSFDFFNGIKDWLQELREHFILVVITNGPEFSQQVKVDRVNLVEHVDHIIIGGLEPAQKPAKSIFDKALSLAGCRQDEVIHIGDSLAADIQGANNADIASIWISHDTQIPNNSTAVPTHIIQSPRELPQLVERLRVNGL